MVSFSRKLFAMLLTLLSISSLEGFCNRKRALDYPKPNFKFLHPKGLTVWYPTLPEVKKIEIKIYVNRRDGPYDISLSTSTISDEKFIANDDNAFIRIHDHLKSDIIFYYGGNNCSVISNSLTVKGSSPIYTKAAKETKPDKLEGEVKLLEGIINDLYNNCSNSTTVSNHLFLNFRPASANLDPQQLKMYTLKELQRKLPKIDWKTVLVRAFYYNDGVGFEVNTVLNKLKALQMFKALARYTVTDLDQQSGNDDDDDDESSPIIFHGKAAAGKLNP